MNTEQTPADIARYIEELITPGSAARKEAVEINLKVFKNEIAEGLRDLHQTDQRVGGYVIRDSRVSDKLLLEVFDDLAEGMRYELPGEDCQLLGLAVGMKVSGVVDFSLASHFKGVNLRGEPCQRKGAIREGSVRLACQKPD